MIKVVKNILKKAKKRVEQIEKIINPKHKKHYLLCVSARGLGEKVSEERQKYYSPPDEERRKTLCMLMLNDGSKDGKFIRYMTYTEVEEWKARPDE